MSLKKLIELAKAMRVFGWSVSIIPKERHNQFRITKAPHISPHVSGKHYMWNGKKYLDSTSLALDIDRVLRKQGKTPIISRG